MTIACIIDAGGLPVLISDTLIGTMGVQRPHVDTPLVPAAVIRERYPEENLRIITGMSRKLTIIAPNFALVWAGQLIAARLAIDDLKNRFNELESITLELLEAALISIDVDGLELQIAGCLADENGFHYFEWESGVTESNPSLPIAIGSGREVFMHHYNAVGYGSEPNVNPWLESVSKGLSLVIKLFGDEIFFGDNPAFLFGGAYEIATFHEGHFDLETNLTFLFWNLDVNDGYRDVTFKTKMLNYYHVEDELFIETCELSYLDKNSFQVKVSSIAKIERSSSNSIDPVSREYSPNRFCVYVNVRNISTGRTSSMHLVVPSDMDIFSYQSGPGDTENIQVSNSWYNNMVNLPIPSPPPGEMPDFPYE